MQRGTALTSALFLVMCLFIGTWFGLCAANLETFQRLNVFTREALAGLGVPLADHGLERVRELQRLIEEAPPDKKPIYVAEKMQESVVHIQTISEQPVVEGIREEFYRRFRIPRRRRGGQASGVIIDAAGLILTNNHVVANATEIYVRLHDGRIKKAKLVGGDPRTDLAVISISAPDLRPAELGDSDKILVGEQVLAFGNPFGLSHTVTQGIISAKGRSNVGIADFEDFIQTDAAINPGNSGGPLVNLRGEVIGINTAILSNTGSYSGISFAIPINMAKAVKVQLIKSGMVTRGYLGIMADEITPDRAGELGLEGKKGALVVEVAPDSPAAKAELKPDDLIIEFDGKSIDGFSSLRNAVALTEIGKKVTVKYIRGGEERQTEVTIVQEPQAETYSGDVLGLVVRELDDGLRSRYRYRRDVEGVVVVEVKPDSITRRDIGEGVVISRIVNLTQGTDTKVRTLDEYKKAVEAIKSGDQINLELRSGPITVSRRLVVP